MVMAMTMKMMTWQVNAEVNRDETSEADEMNLKLIPKLK